MATEFEGAGYRARLFEDLPVLSVADENADVHVTCGDGTVYCGVVATLGNLGYLLSKSRAEGACASGSYVWVEGLVVVREFTRGGIGAALDDLARSGDIARAFVVSE